MPDGPFIHTGKSFSVRKNCLSFFWRFCPFFYIICKRPPFSAATGRFSATGFCWLLALLRFVGTATIAFIKRSTFPLTVPSCRSRPIRFPSTAPRIIFGATAGLSEKYRRPDLFLHSGLHPFLGSEYANSYCLLRAGDDLSPQGCSAGYPICRTGSNIPAENPLG